MLTPNSSGNMQNHGYLGCFHAASARENISGVWGITYHCSTWINWHLQWIFVKIKNKIYGMLYLYVGSANPIEWHTESTLISKWIWIHGSVLQGLLVSCLIFFCILFKLEISDIYVDYWKRMIYVLDVFINNCEKQFTYWAWEEITIVFPAVFTKFQQGNRF